MFVGMDGCVLILTFPLYFHVYFSFEIKEMQNEENKNKSGTLRSKLISTIIYESFIFFFFYFFFFLAAMPLSFEKYFIERRVPLILCPCKTVEAKGEV